MDKYIVSLTTKVSAAKLGKAQGRTLLAIEPEDYTKAEVAALKASGYTVLGYLSCGSVSDEREYYKALKPYCLKKLDDWPHERYLDLRKAAARDWCVDRARAVKAQGFDGWWIDNLDVYEEYPSSAMYNAVKSVLGRIKALGGYVMVNGGSSFLGKLMDNDGGKALYKVQLGAFSVEGNAKRRQKEAEAGGINAVVLQAAGVYRVQAGAFSVRGNAEKMLSKAKAAGFTGAFIVEEGGSGSCGCVDGVTQEEVFSLITSYKGTGKFGNQEKKQSEWYQSHMKRCVSHGMGGFLLEYTKDNVLKLRIRAFCNAHGMACCISENVDL